MVVRLNLLNRILTAIARVLIDDHEDKRNNDKVFDQRPYIRLLSDMMQDLGVCDEKASEPNPAAVPLLSIYHQLFVVLAPSSVLASPLHGFNLSAASTLCHSSCVKEEKGWPHMHRLLHSLLSFLQPFLKSGNMNEPVRKLYKGTLRVLLIILHDFPDFLCEYHLLLCEIIPASCVQLRNLVLSAVPRGIRLADAHAPNFKIESLQEIYQSPRMPAGYANALGNLRQGLDAFLSTSQPPDFPSVVPGVLYSKGHQGEGGGAYNVPLVNVVVIYVLERGAEYHKNHAPPGQLIKESPAAASSCTCWAASREPWTRREPSWF